jgi:polar amino acid transport system substrate-binding protein
MNRAILDRFARTGVTLIAASALAWTAQTIAQTPASRPGTVAADPAIAARRLPPPDIESVYRGPAVDTLATVRKRGALRVGVAVNEPCVMLDAEGALIGYSIDVARRLADDMGVTVEFVETSWSGIIPDLLSRQFDVIVSGLWVTVPRALVINYSSPTAVEGVYVVANRAAAARLKSPADLDRPGTKIVVYAGTLQERLAARRFPKATLVKVDGDSDHLVPVLSGEADAVLVPTFAPQVVVRAAPDKLALPFAQPLSSATTAFGVRKGDPDFLNFLDSWVAVQRDEGWLDERANHWAEMSHWPK